MLSMHIMKPSLNMVSCAIYIDCTHSKTILDIETNEEALSNLQTSSSTLISICVRFISARFSIRLPIDNRQISNVLNLCHV